MFSKHFGWNFLGIFCRNKETSAAIKDQPKPSSPTPTSTPSTAPSSSSSPKPFTSAASSSVSKPETTTASSPIPAAPAQPPVAEKVATPPTVPTTETKTISSPKPAAPAQPPVAEKVATPPAVPTPKDIHPTPTDLKKESPVPTVPNLRPAPPTPQPVASAWQPADDLSSLSIPGLPATPKPPNNTPLSFNSTQDTEAPWKNVTPPAFPNLLSKTSDEKNDAMSLSPKHFDIDKNFPSLDSATKDDTLPKPLNDKRPDTKVKNIDVKNSTMQFLSGESEMSAPPASQRSPKVPKSQQFHNNNNNFSRSKVNTNSSSGSGSNNG